MIIRHLDDGREMAVRLVWENGQPVEKLVPLEEEIARMKAAKTKKSKPAATPARAAPEKPSVTPLQATVILARRGRKEILPQLRQLLDENPELWRTYGNLTLQAQETWLNLIAGKDLLLAESMRRHLDARRNELAGPNASPLERLLVDRLLACEVELDYFVAREAQDVDGHNIKLDEYRLKRQDQAQRQLLAAAKTLATVRQLMSRTVIFGVVQQQPPAPSVPGFIPGVNVGEDSATVTSTTAPTKTMATNRLGKSSGGVNRINATGSQAVIAGKG